MIPITLSQFYFSNPNLINLLGIFFNILNMIYIKLCNNMVIAFAFEVYSIMYHFPRQGERVRDESKSAERERRWWVYVCIYIQKMENFLHNLH